MRELIWSRTTAIWLLLVAATLVSWELGHGLGVKDPRIAAAAIIIVAMVKARFVILDFMEIRQAPNWMRGIGEAWTVTIAAALVAVFLTTTP